MYSTRWVWVGPGVSEGLEVAGFGAARLISKPVAMAFTNLIIFASIFGGLLGLLNVRTPSLTTVEAGHSLRRLVLLSRSPHG
jgi:hypothetical protein